MADVMEYAKRKDGKVGEKYAFYKDPSGYESNFGHKVEIDSHER